MSTFERDGRLWLRGALSPDEVERLLSVTKVEARPGKRLGVAGLAKALAALDVSARIRELWPGMQPVRAVSFDKSTSANWGLPWHQDRVIAVEDKVDMTGFHNWTQKEGVWHCEPPVSYLQGMLFVRFHLDACTADTGAMEIAIGSHARGLVPSDAAEAVAGECLTEITEANAGDVLILPMLTLHRSRPATRPAQRRVLRLDYSAQPLPTPLKWAI